MFSHFYGKKFSHLFSRVFLSFDTKKERKMPEKGNEKETKKGWV